MTINQNELKAIATKYATYCISVRDKLNELPLEFDDWFQKYKEYDNQRLEPEIDAVISYLNLTCKNHGKRGFKVWGKKMRSLIRQKLKDGFDVTDINDVIRVKSVWLKDKNMHKYFRPITLFGNKFEDYLNETTEPLDSEKNDEFTDAIRRAATDTY
tara:strand:- start:62 stop:532 length:471 start_codon:yes stop_codon:yes gene_type:complete